MLRQIKSAQRARAIEKYVNDMIIITTTTKRIKFQIIFLFLSKTYFMLLYLQKMMIYYTLNTSNSMQRYSNPKNLESCTNTSCKITNTSWSRISHFVQSTALPNMNYDDRICKQHQLHNTQCTAHLFCAIRNSVSTWNCTLEIKLCLKSIDNRYLEARIILLKVLVGKRANIDIFPLKMCPNSRLNWLNRKYMHTKTQSAAICFASNSDFT